MEKDEISNLRNTVLQVESVEDLGVKLVVVSTHLKNISQNGNLPQIGGENKKYLKPPPSKPTNLGSIGTTKKVMFRGQILDSN